MMNKFPNLLRCQLQTLLLLCILASALPLVAQNVISRPENSPSAVGWQSLGFSADGKFYASITYGVEHHLNSSESDFFARLQIQHLRGRDSELVLERLLRRSLPLNSASSKISVRSIMLDLLRREARELYNFGIDPLTQGEVLFSEPAEFFEASGASKASSASESGEKMDRSTENMGQKIQEVQAEMSSSEELEDGVSLAMAELMSVVEGQNAADELQQESENPIYIARRNADTTVFYLQKIAMDGTSSLRGQLVVLQSGAFPHRFAFQQRWNSLLQKSAGDLALKLVFVSVSPDARHLVITVRAKENLAAKKVTEAVEGLEGLEQNQNREYATFALAVY